MNKRVIRKFLIWVFLLTTLLSATAFGCLKFWNYFCTDYVNEQYHEKYSAYFDDMQETQIAAARKYGIAPISDREAAKAIIKQENLVKIRSCRNYKVAELRNSIPYLTEDAAWLLTKISENFRDSLEAKGIERHKIIVTSVLRTDEDVQRLMKHNTVAVKNSAHRYATTFDISYRHFETTLFTFKTNEVELKKTLGEVLRDLRNDKLCYVRYEIKPGCFHITVGDICTAGQNIFLFGRESTEMAYFVDRPHFGGRESTEMAYFMDRPHFEGRESTEMAYFMDRPHFEGRESTEMAYFVD